MLEKSTPTLTLESWTNESVGMVVKAPLIYEHYFIIQITYQILGHQLDFNSHQSDRYLTVAESVSINSSILG
jgi:hypothetical protein